MTTSLITAVSENGIIGRKGKLPWHFPEDLKRFKELTIGKAVIMGRKTFESIGGPLPRRHNIVVSRQFGYENKAKGCAVSDSFEEALKAARRVCEEVFVIGGEEIYRQAMPLADRIYLTRIPKTFKGDVYFPEIDEKKWEAVKSEGALFGNLWCQFVVLEKRRAKNLV